MDKILSYLPENVHVRFGWEHEPDYFGAIPKTEYKSIVIPKSWLKHGKRGSYNEWEIKKTYHKKLANAVGDQFLRSTEPLEVLEWNQLETVCYILKKAKNIGFDLLDNVSLVDENDVKYLTTDAI